MIPEVREEDEKVKPPGSGIPNGTIRKKPQNVIIKTKSPRISFNGNPNAATQNGRVQVTRGGQGGGPEKKRRSIEISGEP